MLINELKKFSRDNWWVYMIFIICLFFIYRTNSWNIYEVSLVFVFHFLWDLCIMMMWDYYTKWKVKNGLYAQTGSFIIFSLIWIYSWLRFWKWSYLLPQFLFVWPIIKWFTQKKWINYKFIIIVWIVVLWIYFSLWLIQNIWVLIQILWFIIFPVALSLNSEKIKYFLSLLWIMCIFIWSSYFLYQWFLEKNIIWTDLSYTLLPLTVVVFYLKNIKKYFS